MPEGWKEKMEKNICPVCNKENKRQYRCCSKECTQEFWKIAFWSNTDKFIKIIKEKSNGKCAMCGKEAKSIYKNNKCEFDIDHIVPIALGGNEFDIGNMQILCEDCHKLKTKIDIRKIAKIRRRIKAEQGMRKLSEFGLVVSYG